MAFSATEPVRIDLEAATHSPRVSRLLAELGHQVIVANPRKLRFVIANDSKSDLVDAECLAGVGRRCLLPSLTVLSTMRRCSCYVVTAIASKARARGNCGAMNKAEGLNIGPALTRLPACSAESFAAEAGACVLDDLRLALEPVFAAIAALTVKNPARFPKSRSLGSCLDLRPQLINCLPWMT